MPPARAACQDYAWSSPGPHAHFHTLAPFEMVAMDPVVLFPLGPATVTSLLIYRFSRLVQATPLKEAGHVALAFLNSWVYLYGVPQTISQRRVHFALRIALTLLSTCASRINLYEWHS